MGLNHQSVKAIEDLDKINEVGIFKVLEFGAQQLYRHVSDWGHYADSFYKSLGIKEYKCIDTNGENNALNLDLSKNITKKDIDNYEADLITNFGTLEHTGNFYQGLKNIHNLASDDIIVIHEVPETGSWEDHGDTYVKESFFEQFVTAQKGYEILSLQRYPAQQNKKNGWLIQAVIHIEKKEKFMTKTAFNKLKTYNS